MKRKDILLLLIPSFIFVLAWMSFSIYHNFITSTIPEVLNIQILPISPNFDTNTISSLKNRKRVEPIYEISPSTIVSGTGENPTPTEAPASGNSAKNTTIESLDSNGQSTAGGTLSQ